MRLTVTDSTGLSATVASVIHVSAFVCESQFPGNVVERAGRIRSRLGHQLRASGRRDLRHLVHARCQRQGVVPVDDGHADRPELVRRHAVPHDRTAARCDSVRFLAGAADRRGRRRTDLLRWQQRHVHLHRQRHHADQVDHPRRCSACCPPARGERSRTWRSPPTTRTYGGRRRRIGIGVGHQLHPSGRRDLRHVVHVRLRRRGTADVGDAQQDGHRASTREP